MKPIFFIPGEFSSILHAALDGVKPGRFQRRLLHLTSKKMHVPQKGGQAFSIITCIFGSLTGGYLVPAYGLLALLIVTWLLILIWFVEKFASIRLKRQFVSKLLCRKSIRPNLCLMCYCDLREIDATTCPKCGEPLAPVHDDPDM